MDMAEILNQWDSYQAKEKNKKKQSGHNTVSHKKANAPTPEEKAAKAEKGLRLYRQVVSRRIAEDEQGVAEQGAERH